MANEVLYSDLVSNGGAVAEVLSALVVDQLYDPTDLRSVCQRIDYSTFGSTAMAVTMDATPSAFASTNEDASVANSAYTTSEFQLSVSKYALAYELTDLVGVSGSPIDLDRIVRTLTAGVSLTMTDLICTLFGSLSNSVGTSGVNLSVDDIYSAQFQLNTSAMNGPYTAVLAPVQMNDFRSSLRSETGAIQFEAASADMLATKGPGFQGSWNGIEFYQSDSVVSTGGNRQGAMFGQGCFAYTMAPVSLIQGHIPQQNILVDAGELLVELVRDGYGGQSGAVAHMYPGVIEREDARGVLIATDA
tara:strand:- start:1542 stop:2450 length:909 start_codon:yes stop_codon:yes gene_type:complete